MLGLVRLLTQPRVMGGGALQPAQALDVYLDLTSRDGVGLHPEPASCEAALSEFMRPDLPARMVTDAFLAAFARAGRLRLVTFDRDFERFDGLDLLQLRA
jgi:predicted nucleic acid-binding protein